MPATVAERRLAAQHIARPALATPRAVVSHMGALQAQDHAGALWGIGLRMRAPRLATVRRAIERGEILRTWPMRRTIHFVTADDARGMVKLLAARQLGRSASRRRQLGLMPRDFDVARRALTRALAGGHALARPDAYAQIERAGVRTSGQRGIHILADLAMEGTLCIGPHEGKQATFVLLEEWAKGDRDITLDDIARRYVVSHGPARASDLAWWAGIPLGAARGALAEAKGIMEHEDGWTAARPRVAREPSPAAHLLPAFDEFAVAYKERSAALARVGNVANAQVGLLSPCIVIDGAMVGTWGRTIKKDRVAIALKPLVAWSRDEREAIERAAERFARFLALAPDIEVKATMRKLPSSLTTRA